MEDFFRITQVSEQLLDSERARALALLDHAIGLRWVHEVGSTAVEGVVGKQDLDFLVLVPEALFVETRHQLDQAFERNLNQLSTDIYQGYLVESEHDVAVQLTIQGGPSDTFLAFLQILREDESVREQYNALKLTHNGKPMDVYRVAKREFIESTLSFMSS